ncbi:hypothetical protein, partial [uncultured Marinobacter sp.]|uniref:hypothetical protein n=1 Tax=uncultured Marinobacter sp. TaxID=187379 RepID=UPI002592D163
MGKSNLSKQDLRALSHGGPSVTLSTANGLVERTARSSQCLPSAAGTMAPVDALVMDDMELNLVSMGRMIEEQLFTSVWTPGGGHLWHDPATGQWVRLLVENHVPVLEPAADQSGISEALRRVFACVENTSDFLPAGTAATIGTEVSPGTTQGVAPAAPVVDIGPSGDIDVLDPPTATADEELPHIESDDFNDGHAPASSSMDVPVPVAEAVPAPPADAVAQAGSAPTRRERRIEREELLRIESVSTRHLMTHFPFNPLCVDCAAKLRAQPALRAKTAMRADPELDAPGGPTHFGDLVSMDHLLCPGADAGIRGEVAGLLVADIGTESMAFSGMKKRDAPGVLQALRDFVGTDANISVKLISSDNAAEFVRAATDMGVPHKTGTPYRSTSNGRIENLIGQLLMGSRALLKQAGLPPTWWPLAGAYFTSAHNIVGKPRMTMTPYARRAGGESFPGHHVPFGAACRAMLPDMRVARHKFASRTTFCIFIGYHWGPGQTWSGDYYVSPVEDHTLQGRVNPRVIRVKGGIVLDTSRPWTFPIKNAYEGALKADLFQRQAHQIVQHLPAQDPNTDQGDTGAAEDLDFEQQLWSENDDPPPLDDLDPAAPPAPGLDTEVDESLLGLTPAQRARRIQDDAGLWPPRFGSTRPPNIHPEMWQKYSAAVRRELAADFRKTEAARTAPRTTGTQTGAIAVLEVCTSPDSTLGQIVSEKSDTICRYTASMDFRKVETLHQALADVARHPGAHVMASIPCTAGSSWQRINVRRGGLKQRLRIEELRKDMHILLAHLRIVATAVHDGGGTISFEWPRHCSLWQEQAVRDFIVDFQFLKVDFDGCAVGLVSTAGEPLLKPWRIHTNNKTHITSLIDQRCSKKHQHGKIEGKETARTAAYPVPLCILLHSSFVHSERIAPKPVPATFEELAAAASQQGGECGSDLGPALPTPPGLTLPAGQEPRPKETSSGSAGDLTLPAGSFLQEPRPRGASSVSAGVLNRHLAFGTDLSYNDLGRPRDHPVLFGIDPDSDETEGSFGDVGYAALNAHTSSISPSSPPAASTHRPKMGRPNMPFWCGLLTRVIKAGTDEFKSVPCQEAQKSEKDKLESQDTWDYGTVREWSHIRRDPTLPEATVARLFVIMGRKGDEMDGADGRAAEIKYKARGVLAGNSIQSKGTPAHELFTEVAQTPASLVSARAALAAGALKGHRGTVRDATTAYLQASLKTHYPSGEAMPTQWVRLPRTWWPKDWFEKDGVSSKYYDPVVRLKKALYGHPESEAIWDEHLGSRLRKEGWLPVLNQPGCWHHSATSSSLVVYVDDLLMISAPEHEEALWAGIEKHINFSEPAEPIDRYLGAHYVMEKFKDEHGKECMSFSFEMSDFCSSACRAYEADVQKIIGAAHLKLHKADTPYAAEDTAGSTDEPPGVLSGVCASHLMRLLYAARVARPDIQTAIVRLAKHITKWKARHDRCLQRLFSYVHCSLDLRLKGSMPIGEAANARLLVWPDADLAGDKDSAKATGGFWVELACGDHRWPLAWQSKRQTSTAISTA